jgi:hypothetical protein
MIAAFGLDAKCAETVEARDTLIVQDDFAPAQPPVHPVNLKPVAGAACSVKLAPGLNVPKHREARPPQLIAELDPGAFPVTVPVPETPTLTVKSGGGTKAAGAGGVATITGWIEVVVWLVLVGVAAGVGVNVTVTVPPVLTVQLESVPLQPPPLQEEITNPEAGLAWSVTEVPVGKDAVQVDPQLIPLGVLVMLPEPFAATVSEKVEGVHTPPLPENQASPRRRPQV